MAVHVHGGERCAALALALERGIGPVAYRELLATYTGAEAAFEERVPAARREQALGEAQRVLDEATHRGADVLLLGDAEYPTAFLDLPDPPPFVITLGDRRALQSPGVAIVGTRACTSYGERTASRLAHAFAAAGVTVVSGMALGVDGAAHRATLEVQGMTIAVVGGGVDVPYPRAHRALHERIAERGLIVAERPCGERPGQGAFPRRNRLIAALGRATIVVEAGFKSGALLTAQIAEQIGRKVGVIPGAIDSPQSAGANLLARDGAVLVATIDDALGLVSHGASEGVARSDVDKDIADDVKVDASEHVPALRTPQQERLWRVLVARGPMGSDEIGTAAGLSARDALAALTMLEVMGVVHTDARGMIHRLQ